MANICVTDIMIEGELTTLNKIKDATDKLLRKRKATNPYVWIGDILGELGIKCSETDPQSSGFVTEEPTLGTTEDGTHNLHIIEEGKYCPSNFMAFIMKAFGTRIYFDSQCFDYLDWNTNDEKGKYFEDRFSIVDGLNGVSYFKSRPEMMKYLKKNHNITTLKEVSEREDILYMKCNVLKTYKD